jgi:8-oxo-dGTP pyrophosphatase MutT (NUDIX family)
LRQTHTLLTHHRALNKWLQPGGHADGDPDPLNVALREAREESGLRSIVPLGNDLFDVDVHPIPARGDVPAHFHYDIRFLFEADETEPVAVSGESHDVRWISFDELAQYTDEESILRMVRKVRKRRG